MITIGTIEVDGARVTLLTCEECGATVTFDSRDSRNAVARHAAWHAEQAAPELHVQTPARPPIAGERTPGFGGRRKGGK